MNCPIVCRQFFNKVNIFLVGVYIYFENLLFFFFFFFFFYKYTKIYSRLQANTNKILFQHARFASIFTPIHSLHPFLLPKIALGLPNINARKSGTPNF